jgi:hypothetical protein
MTALNDDPRIEPEILIEEARRRQRHRQAALTGLFSVLCLAAGVFWIVAGGGPPAGSKPTGHGEAPAALASASWHELTPAGGYITPDAQITTVIRWHGELIAAGEGGVPGLPCRAFACNPMVWVAHDGHWHAVFAAPEEGSLANADLVATDHGLLLFQSQEGTHAWRSTNGRVWRSVSLPADVAGTSMTEAVSNGHRVVAIVGNRFAGGPDTAYDESDFVMSSADGVHWTLGSAPDRPQFYSLTTAPGGFLAAGASRASGHQLVWSSANGRVWSVAPIATPPNGRDHVAANGHGFVLEWIPGSGRGAARFWSSPNGRAWTPASVRGKGPTNLAFFPNQRPLLAVPGGFVAFGQSNREIWWSTDGRIWTQLKMTGTPAAALQPVGASVNGDSLLMIEVARRSGGGLPDGATTIWQLNLAGTGTA